MLTDKPLSVADQMKVLQSHEDVATWSLAHLGLPPEWRDTNEEGNTECCQDAVNWVFTLTCADIEVNFVAQGLQPETLPHVSTEGSHDGSYFVSKCEGEWEFYHQERGCDRPTDKGGRDAHHSIPELASELFCTLGSFAGTWTTLTPSARRY